MCFKNLMNMLFPKKVNKSKSNSKKKTITKKVNTISTIKESNYETKESLITEYEKIFFTKITKLINQDKYSLLFQTNLATIINKVSNSKYQSELFRNIDFCIIEKESFKPILLIEINDSTHKQKSRYERDLKVREICKNANIPLVTFYSGKPNTEEYIKSVISKYLVI